MAVEDRMQRVTPGPPSPPLTAGVMFSRLPAGTTSALTYDGRLCRRGQYRFGPLQVVTRYPLGLLRRTLMVDDNQTITVYPRLGRLTRQWHSLDRQSTLGQRPVRHRQNSSHEDFFSLRDWRSGDNRRSIHRRTSARRGSLVIREFQQQQQRDLLILVDLWQPRSVEHQDLQAVEIVVSFAATVVDSLCRMGGCQMDILLAGTPFKWTSGTTSMARRDEVLEHLAVLETHHEDRLPELIQAGWEATKTNTTTLIVSTQPIDWSATDRFAALPTEILRQRVTRHVLGIDPHSDTLAACFYLDDPSPLPTQHP